jgi:hypothetical protein
MFPNAAPSLYAFGYVGCTVTISHAYEPAALVEDGNGILKEVTHAVSLFSPVLPIAGVKYAPHAAPV